MAAFTPSRRRERTEWHRIVIFNERLVDVAEKYLRKGAKVYIEGALQTRKWADQDGTERYVTETVLAQYRGELTMLDGAREGGSEPRGSETADKPEPVGASRGDPDD